MMAPPGATLLDLVQDLHVAIGSVYADALPIGDQAGGVLYAYDG